VLNDPSCKNADYSAYLEELKTLSEPYLDNLKKISEEFISFVGEEYRQHFMDRAEYFTDSDCDLAVYPIELD